MLPLFCRNSIEIDITSESRIGHEILIERGFRSVGITAHPQTCHAKRENAQDIQRDKAQIEPEQAAEMAPDQLGASADQFLRRKTGEIQKQVTAHRIPDPDGNGADESGQEQKEIYDLVAGNVLRGKECQKEKHRHHARELQDGDKSTYDHCGIGVVAEGIQQIPDPGGPSELQRQKDAGEAQTQHIGACINYKENDHREQKRDQDRTGPEIRDQL